MSHIFKQDVQGLQKLYCDIRSTILGHDFKKEQQHILLQKEAIMKAESR